MKDEHDTETAEIFPGGKKLLKGKNKDFQRLHIDKIIKGGTKKTTVSIETLSYEFLAIKLGETPHTREANKIIKEWLLDKMEVGEKEGTYDTQAPYSFSAWLKKTILWEIADKKITQEYWNKWEIWG